MVAHQGRPVPSVSRAGWARQERFRRRWSVAVWADCVVLLSPVCDHDLCFLEGVDDLPVQEVISELSIEAFVVTILRRRDDSMNSVLTPLFPSQSRTA